MSAIVGMYFLDGQPVDRTDLGRMIDILTHRGPDGEGLWNEGPIGLGHRMLWTTPESLQEQLPLVSQTGDFVLTADARIDNRDELIAALGLAEGRPGDIADSELILTAYEKWGEYCVERLLGDFAFALWDGQRRKLFCARDHFGVRSFYYYRSDRLFVFASEIKALLCLPEVPRYLNEVRVADHLALVSHDDRVATFYQNILRLPPGHTMTVRGRAARLRSYWSLNPEYELQLGSDDEYAEAFREIFTEAVRCRLRSAFPVGTELSGGMDSSSVTCVAREVLAQSGDLPMHTFSAIYDEVPQCDERPFINAVLAQGDLSPHYVRVEQMSPLGSLDRLMWLEDEPLFIHNTFMTWGLLQETHKQGVRVLLDGSDGDSIVSHGRAYLCELARAGRWAAFDMELTLLCQRYDRALWPYLRHYGLTYLTELARGMRWATFARGVNEISKRFDISRRNLALNYGVKRLFPGFVRQVWRTLRGPTRNGVSFETERPDATIKPSFVRRTGLEERIHAHETGQSMPAQTAREEHYRNLVSGLHPFTFEMADRLATACSIERRHPFYDKRLAEFCLALPPQQKLYEGWNRMIIRRAMTNILPEEVRWRGDKSDLGACFCRGLLRYERDKLDELIMNDAESIEEYVDISALREAYQRYANQLSSRDAERVVWPVVTLALWLRYTGITP